jgi:hypothetical protein
MIHEVWQFKVTSVKILNFSEAGRFILLKENGKDIGA